MLGPTDQGHFLKYLTTLGVAIVVASLGLGGYLLQTQSDLLVKREELAKLTPVAREAIDHKQQVALQVTTFAPLMLGLMALGGVIMAVIGLTSWRKKQALLDERDDERAQAEVAKINRELELMQMTPEEARESLAAEAEELVEDESTEHGVSNGRPPELVDDPAGVSPTEIVRGEDVGFVTEHATVARSFVPGSATAAAGLRVRQATEQLVAKFELAHPAADIRQDMNVGSFRVDALAVLDKEKQFFVFDLRITTPKNFRNRLTEAAVTLSGAVEVLARDLPSYRAFPVFVVLIQRDANWRVADWRKRVREVSAAVRNPPIVLTYREDTWESLSFDTFDADVASEYKRRRWSPFD